MKISEYVRNRRGDTTVLDFSKMLGISNTQLARIEKGYWDNPSPTQVVNLCKIFGLLVYDLDKFNIPEDVLHRAFLQTEYEYSHVVHTSILNFYKNATFGNKKFSELYKEPEFEEFKGFDLKFLVEDIDAVCVSKKTKSDYIPFYFVGYTRTYGKDDNEIFADCDGIVRKYYYNFVCTISRMLLNGKIKKAIIITNSKITYDIFSGWFDEIPDVSPNKELILAYCSIKNKGCECYYKKI